MKRAYGKSARALSDLLSLRRLHIIAAKIWIVPWRTMEQRKLAAGMLAESRSL